MKKGEDNIDSFSVFRSTIVGGVIGAVRAGLSAIMAPTAKALWETTKLSGYQKIGINLYTSFLGFTIEEVMTLGSMNEQTPWVKNVNAILYATILSTVFSSDNKLRAQLLGLIAEGLTYLLKIDF